MSANQTQQEVATAECLRLEKLMEAERNRSSELMKLKLEKRKLQKRNKVQMEQSGGSEATTTAEVEAQEAPAA